ncbi:MAG TPA: hypothetical protein VMS96_00480 [Terriglobales bacterium]|nr:hypothetical protein [Terriglobales bacterium]
MTNWILAVTVLLIPCYFGMIQIRDLITAARNGQLKCPVRKAERGKTVSAA